MSSFAQPEIAARAVAENADIVIGVKVRMSENVIAQHGIEPLKRAIQACEIASIERDGKAMNSARCGHSEDRRLRPGGSLAFVLSPPRLNGAPFGTGASIGSSGRIVRHVEASQPFPSS